MTPLRNFVKGLQMNIFVRGGGGENWHSKIFRINRHSITTLCRLRREEWVKSPLKEKSFLSCKLIDSAPASFSFRSLSIRLSTIQCEKEKKMLKHKKIEARLQTLLKFPNDIHSKGDFHNFSLCDCGCASGPRIENCRHITIHIFQRRPSEDKAIVCTENKWIFFREREELKLKAILKYYVMLLCKSLRSIVLCCGMWHRIASLPEIWYKKTHKYSRVNTCWYYYFALFYANLCGILLCFRSLPSYLSCRRPPENPFFNFPQFFCRFYMWQSTSGIIFNFSIIKCASVYTHK